MKHEYGKLLENETEVTGKAVSTRTERITGLFLAPQMPGGLVWDIFQVSWFQIRHPTSKPHRNHVIANIFIYWVLTIKDRFYCHEMPVGFMVYKVALRQVSVSVFSFICVINNSTSFSYSVAYNPGEEKWTNLRVHST